MQCVRWLAGLLPLVIGCDSPGDRAASQNTSDAPSDTAGRSDATATAPSDTTETSGAESQVCTRWREDYAVREEGDWTGSVIACDAGDYLEPGPSNTLRQVNLYRWLAGLPPVVSSPDLNAAAQACALIMQANRAIEHAIPDGWDCLSAAGKTAAGLSNLATTAGVESIDLYMTDNDVDNLGHRRWLLSNSLGPVGIGSTSGFSCLQVLTGTGDARARWVTWPPPGDVPIQAMHIASWMDVDAAGWSIQSDYIDLRRGEVRVTRGGIAVATDTWELDPGYGSSFGLGIRPRGWRTAVGESYEVTLGGLSEPVSWRFTLVDCR